MCAESPQSCPNPQRAHVLFYVTQSREKKSRKKSKKHLLLRLFDKQTSTLYLTTLLFLTVNTTTEEEQFLLSPAANSWESRMPDSCRDLMQESTSSRPVVSSSSMSFCPSMAQDKSRKLHWFWVWVCRFLYLMQKSFPNSFTSRLQNCSRGKPAKNNLFQ